MKIRYKRALFVLVVFLVISVAIGAFCRISFGGVSLSQKNSVQPFEATIKLGSSSSVSDLAKQVNYKPLWASKEDVSVKITVPSDISPDEIIAFDKDSGRMVACGIGKGLITVTSTKHPSLSLKINFKVDFNSANTENWVKNEMSDGFLPKSKIDSISQVIVSDTEDIDVYDLSMFKSLKSVVIEKSSGVINAINANDVASNVVFFVNENQYLNYLKDSSWSSYSNRIFPNPGIGKNALVLNLDGGLLHSSTEEKDFFLYSFSDNDTIDFKSYTAYKQGYTFEGWDVTNHEGDSISVKGTYSPQGSVKAYAKWSENSYTIEYNMNATGIDATNFPSQTLKYSERGSISKNSPIRNGYTFIGWAEYSNAVDPKYTIGQEISKLSAKDNGKVVLYAVWDTNKYTIYYYTTGTTTYEDSKRVAFDQKVKVPEPLEERPGYKCVGWSTKPNGTTVDYKSGEYVENLSSENNGRVSLYAIWEAIKYNIKFYSSGKETGLPNNISKIEYGKDVVLPTKIPKKTGHTFLGWSLDKSDATKSFDRLPEGAYASGATVKNLTQEDGKDVILYPVWRAEKFVLNFNLNGRSGSLNSQIVECGKTFTIQKVTVSNYTLAGWAFTSSATTPEIPANDLSVEHVALLYEKAGAPGAAVTIYAVWKANYTISYDANGGSTTPKAQTAVVDTEIKLAPEIAKNGYVFNGWQYGSTLYTAEQSVKNITKDAGQTVVLKAVWKPIEYTVKYNLDGGAGSVSSTSAKYDTSFTLPAAPTKSGFTFLGWSYNGATYSAGQSVSNLTTKNNSTITMTAMWKAQ